MADIIKENCEGTGRPAAWTNYENDAYVNWDYTTAPLAGSQSLRLTCPSGWTVDYASFTEMSPFYLYFMFNVTTEGNKGGNAFDIVHLDNDAFQQIGAITWSANNKLSVMDWDLGGNETTYSLSTGQTYHVWMERTKGASLKVWINTSATKPGTATYDATPCYNDGVGLLAVIGDPGIDIVLDNILVCTTQIGSDPFGGGASSTPSIPKIMNHLRQMRAA